MKLKHCTVVYAQASSSGRSMLEMLGVIGIIGLLTAGALWGFSLAMDAYYYQKTVADLNNIIARTNMVMHGRQQEGTFSAAKLVDSGILPSDFCLNLECTLFKKPMMSAKIISSGDNVNLQSAFEITSSGVCVKLLMHNYKKDFGLPVYIDTYEVSNGIKGAKTGETMLSFLNSSDAIKRCTVLNAKNTGIVFNIAIYGGESGVNTDWQP